MIICRPWTITTRNDAVAEYFAFIHTLPPEEAIRELLGAISDLVQWMDLPTVLALREMVARDFPESEGLILIDGNLALREIRDAA
jgi:hypothetical protein